MADLPRYEKWALLLTAGFVLFTGGWFLAGHSSPEPYTITAAPEDLERLPGIGPAKAEAIAAYRTEHGPFRTVDQLMEVSGIGEATLEALRPYITASAPG